MLRGGEGISAKYCSMKVTIFFVLKGVVHQREGFGLWENGRLRAMDSAEQSLRMEREGGKNAEIRGGDNLTIGQTKLTRVLVSRGGEGERVFSDATTLSQKPEEEDYCYPSLSRRCMLERHERDQISQMGSAGHPTL